MKKLSFAFIIVISVCLLQSCGNNTDNTGNIDSAGSTSSTSMGSANTGAMNDTSTAAMSTANLPPLDKDAMTFAEKAASGGMMEVQLGQMAQEKAQSQRVKDFGAMMVRDHSQANDELKSLASARGLNASAMKPEHQKHVDEMGKKTAADFDKAYMSMMVKDHKEDISEFKKASQNLKDSTLKGFAARTLPVLEMHLDSAQAISKAQ